MITPKAINRKKRSSISLIKGFIVFLLITSNHQSQKPICKKLRETVHQQQLKIAT